MVSVNFNGIQGQRGPQVPNHDAFQDLNLDTFIQLLVAEMSNQDPLDPMDNQEILQQISQIRSIEASTRLTTTLQAVLLGQNLATASGLLGQRITGLTDDGQTIQGYVERVSVAEGTARLHLGQYTVKLQNVQEILPYSS